MNLNKYHSTGRLYTDEEAKLRAAKLLLAGRYITRGYLRNGEAENHLNPWANEAKRQARANKSRLITSLRRGRA